MEFPTSLQLGGIPSQSVAHSRVAGDAVSHLFHYREDEMPPSFSEVVPSHRAHQGRGNHRAMITHRAEARWGRKATP